MNAALGTSINSTIVRSRNSLWAIVRAYFAIASRLLPDLARRQAERLFTVPPRYAGRRPQPVDARRETVVAGKPLARGLAGRTCRGAGRSACSRLGRARRANGKLRRTAAGERLSRRVVRSAGPWRKRTRTGRACRISCARWKRSLPRTDRSRQRSATRSGRQRSDLPCDAACNSARIVFVSPPASISEHAHKFARLLGITPAIREAMRHRLEHRYGVRFAEIDRIDELARLRLPALFVHDGGDAEVPFEHTLRLSARMPGARLIKTYGLGHYRLLRD